MKVAVFKKGSAPAAVRLLVTAALADGIWRDGLSAGERKALLRLVPAALAALGAVLTLPAGGTVGALIGYSLGTRLVGERLPPATRQKLERRVRVLWLVVGVVAAVVVLPEVAAASAAGAALAPVALPLILGRLELAGLSSAELERLAPLVEAGLGLLEVVDAE